MSLTAIGLMAMGLRVTMFKIPIRGFGAITILCQKRSFSITGAEVFFGPRISFSFCSVFIDRLWWSGILYIMVIKSLTIPVSFLKEGKQFVAYTPALDLSSAGRTLSEAKKNFGEAVQIFLKELTRMGTLEDVLVDLGWEKKDNHLVAPELVAQEMESFKVPFIRN